MSNLPLIIEPEELSQQLGEANKIIIIEQAPFDDYAAGHISGSIWLDFRELQAASPYPGQLPDLDTLSALFSRLGIEEDSHIICSDGEGGGWAGRLIWILDSLGHQHYSLLNGGLSAWKASDLPITTVVPEIAPSHYQAQLLHPEYTIHKDEILTCLAESNFAVWDARSKAEYTGEKAAAARGGHIPGARHYEWTQAMDFTNGLRLKPLETIKAELKQIGLNRHQHIITHCQSHHRSGLTYVIGKALGFNIRAYAGSWADWGNDPSTPIALGDLP